MNTLSTHHLPRKLPLAVATTLLVALLLPIACSDAAENGGPGAAAAAAQGDMISRLPATATTIGFIDFASLRNSEAYDFVRDQGADIGNVGDLEEIIERTGIDPRTDIHGVAFAVGSLRDISEGGGGAALVVADFDRAKVEASLAELPSHELAGHRVHVLGSVNHEAGEPDEGDAEEAAPDTDTEDDEGSTMEATGVVTILDDQTLVAGTEAMVQAILEVANGAASARTNDRLMELLEDVDTGAQIWGVSLQDELFDSMAPAQGMPQIPIDRIKAMIVSVRLTDGVALQLRGRTDREEDAKLLGDSLNGMLAFGKMMLQSNTPKIFEIVDRAIRAGNSGRDVTIRAELSMADIEALRDYARSAMEGDAQKGA